MQIDVYACIKNKYRCVIRKYSFLSQKWGQAEMFVPVFNIRKGGSL